MVDLAGLDPTDIDETLLAHTFSELQHASPIEHGDLVRVACSPKLGLAVGLTMPKGQLLVRRGLAGASTALLESAHPTETANRFDRVVIASGNAIFTDLATHLAHLNTPTHIVSRNTSLAHTLHLAATTTTTLIPTTTPTSHAA